MHYRNGAWSLQNELNSNDYFYTSLGLTFKEKLLRHRLVYPAIDSKDRHEDVVKFEPNTTVCFIRDGFARKKFAPTELVVFRTVTPGMCAAKIEGVNPGGQVLLIVSGETRISRTRYFFETLQKQHVDLGQLSDSVFAAIHGRNEANMSLELLAERVVEEAKL